MNLFDKLPDSLFSILSSKHKDIYVDALFTLRMAYQENFILQKDDLISLLIATLEDRMLSLEDEELPEERNLSSLAHFLLRKLESTGWIEKDYIPGSFEEQIIVHNYAIKIINTLHEILTGSEKEYNGYVYSTYSSLKTANQERDDYMYSALKTAFDNTNQLIDELKSISNEIRYYYRLLSERQEIREILQDHFEDFKQLIEDRIIYPLKTFDSVPRFKGPIMAILREWLYDDEALDRLIQSSLQMKAFDTREEAHLQINYMIGEVQGSYEGLDELLAQVDKKNNSYIRASWEKISYLLNTDRSIKGKLIEILKQTSRNTPLVEEIQEQMMESVALFQQDFLDEKALFVRRKKESRQRDKVLKMDQKVDEELLLKEIQSLSRRIDKSYSHQKVMDFMKDQFKGRDEIFSSDLTLPGDEEFILTILGVLKQGEERTFYRVEFLTGISEVDGYKIPSLKFVRKKGVKDVD